MAPPPVTIAAIESPPDESRSFLDQGVRATVARNTDELQYSVIGVDQNIYWIPLGSTVHVIGDHNAPRSDRDRQVTVYAADGVAREFSEGDPPTGYLFGLMRRYQLRPAPPQAQAMRTPPPTGPANP